MYPSEYKYTKEHEWVSLAGDRATIGITDYAQHELGDVVYVDLPKVGTKLKAAEPLGTVESVKAVSDIYSPVSGQVVEVNTELPDKLETLSTDPYGAGWIAKIELDAPLPDDLMDYATYQKQCAEEGH